MWSHCICMFDISECHRLVSLSFLYTHGTMTHWPCAPQNAASKSCLSASRIKLWINTSHTHTHTGMYTHSYADTEWHGQWSQWGLGVTHLEFYSSFVLQLCTERNFTQTVYSIKPVCLKFPTDYSLALASENIRTCNCLLFLNTPMIQSVYQSQEFTLIKAEQCEHTVSIVLVFIFNCFKANKDLKVSVIHSN